MVFTVMQRLSVQMLRPWCHIFWRRSVVVSCRTVPWGAVLNVTLPSYTGPHFHAGQVELKVWLSQGERVNTTWVSGVLPRVMVRFPSTLATTAVHRHCWYMFLYTGFAGRASSGWKTFISLFGYPDREFGVVISPQTPPPSFPSLRGHPSPCSSGRYTGLVLSGS